VKYIIIPQMKVLAANAVACNFVINSAPIFASVMFAHNLQLKTGISVSRVAYNHLDVELLAENKSPFFGGAYQPHQRRGSTLINKTDYVGSGTSPTLSLQPTCSEHLLVTLILETPDEHVSVETVESFLRGGKLAGGNIIQHGAIVICDSELDVQLHIKTGFWLVARPDLLQHGPKMLEQFLQQATSKTESWITPIVYGYAAITAQEPRNHVRAIINNMDPSTLQVPLHAFAEPLVGLAQFVSVNEYKNDFLPFWRQSTPKADVWLVSQSGK
jgi:CRISPR-associated protein Csy2